jgi:hypothetical protein
LHLYLPRSYENTSRGRIFRREQHNVVDDVTMLAMIRYNRFQTDPTGSQTCAPGFASASNAIAERGDLTAPNSGCCDSCGLSQIDEAAIDAKVTSWARMQSAVAGAGTGSTLAQSGPTFTTQPPFRWSTSPFAAVPHYGQPDLWAFAPVDVEWAEQAPAAKLF